MQKQKTREKQNEEKNGTRAPTRVKNSKHNQPNANEDLGVIHSALLFASFFSHSQSLRHHGILPTQNLVTPTFWTV